MLRTALLLQGTRRRKGKGWWPHVSGYQESPGLPSHHLKLQICFHRPRCSQGILSLLGVVSQAALPIPIFRPLKATRLFKVTFSHPFWV